MQIITYKRGDHLVICCSSNKH